MQKLKKLILFCAMSLLLNPASYAADLDPLHLSGQWECIGADKHDGNYQGALLTLAVDKDNSDFTHNYGAYHFSLKQPDGNQYTGEAVASGNELAIYFENTAKDKLDDRGVGIAQVVYGLSKKGAVLYKFYYQPAYQGGGNGYEECIKKN